MTTKPYSGWRLASIALGLLAAGLGCYGAWDYALKLEGKVSYVVLAAPVIGAAAAIIPPLAEWCWHEGMRLKAFLWCLVLLPAAATVFFGASERVHLAKAGAEAERQAQRQVADRAKVELTEAKVEKAAADKAADRYAALKEADCRAKCATARAAKARADDRLQKAQAALQAAEAASLVESDLKAPPWLIPAALDLIAFMAIWSGLTGPRPKGAGEVIPSGETVSREGTSRQVEEAQPVPPVAPPVPPKGRKPKREATKEELAAKLQREVERQKRRATQKREARRAAAMAKKAEETAEARKVAPLKAVKAALEEEVA